MISGYFSLSRPAPVLHAVSVLLAALVLFALPPRSAAAEREYRVLYVMSYHSPWRWTDWQLEGFQEALRGLKVSYRSFQMDTKRNSAPEQKEARGREARALIDDWKPDLVYASDDDAQQYVVRHYLGSGLPFVFSGVNSDPAVYGFTGSANVTGILEQEHFVESVRLLKRLAPSASRIALVFDDARMWDPVRARIRDGMRQLPGMRVVAADTVLGFDEYKKKIREYQESADIVGIIGIFNFKDKAGRNVPYQDVLKWTAENSRLPDFSFWIDRIHHGTVAAVTVSEREQGRAAGRLARAILVDGKSPASFAMEPTTKGLPVISLARARKLGLTLDADLLLSAEVVRDFEWEKP